MQRTAFILIFIFLILLKPVYSQSDKKRISREEYINSYSKLAIKEMKRSGVPASITLAQGMLESDNGNSTLARKANNHFGIKCHSTWNGKKYFHDDDEKQECFRKYKSVHQSFLDHSDFLRNGKRYKFLFDLKPDNYKAWARGLKKAGYATNPEYANLLIKIIKENKLYEYDTGKKIKRSKEAEEKKESKAVHLADVDNYTIGPIGREVLQRNRIDYIIVKKEDTFYKITEEFDLILLQVYKYNDLPKDAVINEGDVLYIQPKRSKAEYKYEFHIVKEGETMYSISQLYGIKLKQLYKKNLMQVGNEPVTDQKIWLRKRKTF